MSLALQTLLTYHVPNPTLNLSLYRLLQRKNVQWPAFNISKQAEFYHEALFPLWTTPKAGGPPLIDCIQMLMTHICSYVLYLRYCLLYPSHVGKLCHVLWETSTITVSYCSNMHTTVLLTCMPVPWISKTCHLQSIQTLMSPVMF